MSLTKVHNRMNAGAVVSVLDYGATGDGVTDDTIAINAAIATGRNVIFPETENSYYITGALTPLVRWQTVTGTGYTRIRADSSTSYTVFTLTTNNTIEKLDIEGTVLNTNLTGIKFSSGTLTTDMSAQNIVNECWLRFLNKGIDFDNGYSNTIRNTEIRDCNIGTDVSPVSSDNPSNGYQAMLQLYSCRFYNNQDYDVYYFPVSPGRAALFMGCTFDAMPAGATASVYLNNAINATFTSCYHEAGTTNWAFDLVSCTDTGINGCYFNQTKGINIDAGSTAIRDSWSSASGSANDAIIATTTPTSIQLRIENSKFLSTAHDFEGVATLSLSNATLRVGGIDRLHSEGLLREWTPSYTSGFSAATYASQSGWYVRQGDVVTAWFFINLSSSTPSGNIQITLPFVSKNLSPTINNNNGVLHIQSNSGTLVNNAPILRLGNNSDVLHFQTQSTTGAVDMAGSELGTGNVNGTITYNIA
jgi:hypothetical protein